MKEEKRWPSDVTSARLSGLIHNARLDGFFDQNVLMGLQFGHNSRDLILDWIIRLDQRMIFLYEIMDT